MIDLDHTGLVATPDEVARMTLQGREGRVEQLVALAHTILDDAITDHVLPRSLAGTVILYSGGNDSTLLAHLMRHRATHAAHANTGIGVEETREFVRETCRGWGLPLIEKHPPAGSTFRDLVLDQGMPGPAHHWKMYQRLKERSLRQVRGELVKDPRKERVVFLAGRRRTESARRIAVPVAERVGSTVWVSPLVLWTKMDMNTYRIMRGDVPRNQVADTLHMSGECLCGAFAHKGELEEIGMWYPQVREQIERLEAEVLATGKFPAWRCRWGWGADKELITSLSRSGMSDDEVAALFTRSVSGPLCTTCDSRATGGDSISVAAHTSMSHDTTAYDG